MVFFLEIKIFNLRRSMKKNLNDLLLHDLLRMQFSKEN